VLRNVSLAIEPGEVVAVVGESGSGKSTLASILARLYDPGSGRVLVDGQDTSDYTRCSLRDNLGVVLQDSFLFTGTVRENIELGRPGASADDVRAAARTANAEGFVDQLPDGFETLVGERGATLSGGQRQRIAIARAVLRDPRILILDEATSSLDSEAERVVQEALNRVMRGRTTLAIAHRLSTIQHADRIYVLDRGRVVECGAHEELLRDGGQYARLWALQSGAAPLAARATEVAAS
jgi:ABC-type multidrug transport system fused ATPase/permease subunit